MFNQLKHRLMKKLILVIFVAICVQIANANPITPPLPKIMINEFAFETGGKWKIEIESYYYNLNYIDSIYIVSSSGRSKVKNYTRCNDYYQNLYVIASDDLNTELNIHPEGDIIKFEYYYSWEYYWEYYNDSEYDDKYTVENGIAKATSKSLVFGNIENSFLLSPKIGQSISTYFGDFGVGSSPTIGYQNDSTGMMATMKGYIYDKDGRALKSIPQNSYLILDGTDKLKINEDGSYSTRIISNDKDFLKIYNPWQVSSNTYFSQTVDIIPIHKKIIPDTTIIRDIYLISKIYDNVNEIEANQNSTLKIFPNPLKNQSFNYEITVPVKSSECFIEIYDVLAKKIAKYVITEDKGKLKLPSNIAKGTYFVNLMVNNKKFGTSKLLVE